MRVFPFFQPHVALPDIERHPQEDYFLVSDKYPIFVVADGVTLEKGPDGKYPDPSGAGEAAQAFCEAVLEEAEHLYDQISGDIVPRLFRAGNSAVGAVNKKHGRSKKNSNFWDHDLFATTAAFGAIVKDRLYWFVISDAGVATIANSNLRVLAPFDWEGMADFPPDWNTKSEMERRKIIRSVYRNPSNSAQGYGVATGEKEAERFLRDGVIHLRPDTRILIYSDGFEHHLNESQFISLIERWPKNFQDELLAIDKELTQELPKKYGRERTLIAVSL